MVWQKVGNQQISDDNSKVYNAISGKFGLFTKPNHQGWEETKTGEATGGKHRQWKGPDGELRRWDREGREGGKERGPHWHDPRYPGEHIELNR
ncbi:MAG: hypothetical protein D3904_04085 [Candidatus Electrothrix sp. EH2]|nr:hypothetical protein [Candidatus Electrothrix sp. EH2]